MGGAFCSRATRSARFSDGIAVAATSHTCFFTRSRRNPFYKNERKAVEAHILHDFGADFYGAHMRLAVVGYLRDEAPFPSLDALIAAIHTDIRLARESLAGGGAYALGDGAAFLAPRAAQQL